MKRLSVLSYLCLSTLLGQPLNGQQSARAESSSISPDKQWEYKCAEFGLNQCAPEMRKSGTDELAVDFDEVNVYDPEAAEARVVWAPDSKRFAFNYSPPHPHHTTYKTVAFFQLRDEKWVVLRSPEDTLVKLAKELLPKNVHKTTDELIPDVVKVRSWSDASTVIVFSAWHPWKFDRHSNQLEAALLLTINFKEDGSWTITKKQRLAKKEIEKFESED